MGTPLDTHEGVGHERARSRDDSWMPRRTEVAGALPSVPAVSYDAIKPQVIEAARNDVADAYARIEAEQAAIQMNAQSDRNEL